MMKDVDVVPVVDNNDDTHSCSSFDDLESFMPSFHSEDYIRVGSPSCMSSHHSSNDDDFDASKYAVQRNTSIEKDFWVKQAELTKLNYYTDPRERKIFKQVDGVDEGKKGSIGFRKFAKVDDSKRVYDDHENDTSDSDASGPYINVSQFKKTMRQIMKDAAGEKYSFISSLPGGVGGGIQFCHLKFQHALQMKWNVLLLRRFEEILGGRGQYLDVVPPKKWMDHDRQLASIYGPVDMENENYKTLLCQFQAQRLKMYIDMLQTEIDVLNIMLESGRRLSEWSRMAVEVKEERLQLETKLLALSEANLDISPYSSGLGMDFFVLPRPSPTIHAYTLRPKELEANLIEYNITDETGEIRIVGYNPALIDVGCIYNTKIVGDKNRRRYFSGIGPTRKAYKQWYETLLNLKEEVQKYPVGVESTMLITKYRERMTYFDEERVFGRYSDEEGVLHVSDVFYPQYLGKDKRIILFSSLYEGLIITPEEIFLRVWSKIRHILEANKSVQVAELQIKYEKLFGQPLYPLCHWGFSGVIDFIQYSFENFSKELAYVTCVKENEVKAVVEADEESEWEDVTDDESDIDPSIQEQEVYLSQNSWSISDELLPQNYVFKFLDFPPFDII